VESNNLATWQKDTGFSTKGGRSIKHVAVHSGSRSWGAIDQDNRKGRGGENGSEVEMTVGGGNSRGGFGRYKGGRVSRIGNYKKAKKDYY